MFALRQKDVFYLHLICDGASVLMWHFLAARWEAAFEAGIEAGFKAIFRAIHAPARNSRGRRPDSRRKKARHAPGRKACFDQDS
jgi:hypothetical protein